MGVLLQGFYKLPPNDALPSPADGNAAVPWWWDHLAAQAEDLSLAGFTAVWLPPVLKTDSGASPGADGYGPFDDYDIGSRKQKGSLPTRYGSREQLQRCAAIMRANGLDIYLDMVEHQRSGDTTPFVFRYPGANGTPNVGRFPKNPDNFIPGVPRDPDLGGPVADDIAFGRELAPMNGKPFHYVIDHLIDAADWLTRALDVQGYRIDDVKGLSTDFLRPFLESKSMNGKFAVGEFFDGNPALVNNWVFNPTGMQGRSSAFDFPLKFQLNSMCNNPGRSNMAALDHAGLAGISPGSAVTFVENHDTDLSGTEKIFTNKLMGYAYILTSEGYPCVYYRDYSTDQGCFGLKPEIDNLIWIHEILADGPTQQRFKDFNVLSYERLGGAHLLVGLNNDPGGDRTIQVFTGFGSNVGLHDYSGHAPDVTTGGDGAVTITVPRNVNGLGYVCYSRAGQDRALPVNSHPVNQDFEGAADLDILPATNGRANTAGNIWCKANASVTVAITIDRAGWTAASAVDLSLLFPDKTTSTLTITSLSPANPELQATTKAEGFYGLQVTARSMPASNLSPAFKVSATYTAPKTLNTAQLTAPAATLAAANPASVGKWSAPFDLKNVAIHAHLLPTGKILYWGRRKDVGSQVFATLNEHATLAYVWDPSTGVSTPTKNQPALADGTPVNLFCSGHTFLADGRLMVVGGHLFDSQGVNQSCTYDPATDEWTPEALMNEGRWYPSAVTLPDGGVLVLSGSFPVGPLEPPVLDGQTHNGTNPIPQIWRGTRWQSMTDFKTLQLFPRFHVEPTKGQVFMSGPLPESYFFDTTNPGTWTAVDARDGANRDYAPSVMYDTGKVLYIGGGLDPTLLPTNAVEMIDLNEAQPKWKNTSAMHFRRRQHNATILPDGSVLVTGGTQGLPNNGQAIAFNNLTPGAPIHAAELWEPATGNWTILAEEAKDRCYHSTAVLLPDGRVFSAGGGEYAPTLNVANPAVDSHIDAQLFSPPYLFRGPRPTVEPAPDSISYGKDFDLIVPAAEEIVKVSWIRLASVTHSFDQNQRLNFLSFVKGKGKLTVSAPANANIAPPGHYMLFVVNQKGVPSIGQIVRIFSPVPPVVHAAAFALLTPAKGPVELNAEMIKNATTPEVTIGITPTCPYGLAVCWGGAHDALNQLSGVKDVRPIADGTNSTAFVYLKDDTLPDIDVWRREFEAVVNGSYQLRGMEMTLEGPIANDHGLLTLLGNETRQSVVLAPLDGFDKVQWNLATHSNWPVLSDEQTAYQRLSERMQSLSMPESVQVTGPLKKNENGFFMEVRTFSALLPALAPPATSETVAVRKG